MPEEKNRQKIDNVTMMDYLIQNKFSIQKNAQVHFLTDRVGTGSNLPWMFD